METTSSHGDLTIDVGNSAVKAAVFRSGKLLTPVIRFAMTDWHMADELVTNHRVENIIYSSVANVLPQKWMDKWQAAGCRIVELSGRLPLPFVSAYETMDTLGHDRIAVVAGSLAVPPRLAPAYLRPNLLAAPVPLPARLVVDAGTCVTADLIDAHRVYRGGNISPGLRMRLEAMHTLTARLPEVMPGPLEGYVGTTTEMALRHGAQAGLACEVEGLFRRLQVKYPDLELLLTGGDGEWLHRHLSIPSIFNPTLVLLGLQQILSNYVHAKS